MQIASPIGTIFGKNTFDIRLRDGRTVTIWRDNRYSPWKIDAAQEDLAQAGQQLSRIARYLRAAGEGQFHYRSRIFTVKPQGHELLVTIHNAQTLGTTAQRLSELPKLDAFTMPLDGNTLQAIHQTTKEQVAVAIRRNLPHLSNADVEELAEQTTQLTKGLDESVTGFGQSLLRPIAIHSLAGGGIAALLDASITTVADLVAGRDLDAGRIAGGALIAFASGTVGTALGQGTVLVFTRNALLNEFAQTTASALGLPASTLMTNAAGVTVAGGAFSLAYSLLGYELGLMDGLTARRTAIAGVAGSVAGAVVTTTTMALVMTYGTASTGIAISGLSGAAATNASLAFLGGGSLAAGGGGVALGSTILTGGAAIVIIGVGVGVMYVFHYMDKAKETKRIELMIEYFQNQKSFAEARFQHAS